MNSIAGEDPREALIKAIAALAAEVACFGVSSGFEDLMKAFAANDNDEEDGKGKKEERDNNNLTDAERKAQQRERRDQSLHDIIDGINYEDEDRRTSEGPRERRTPQRVESDFLGQAISELTSRIEHVVEQVGDDIAKELGVRYQHLNEALEAAKKELGLSAIASYKALRDMGASVKEAWNKAILLTAENFKTSATKLYQKNGGVKPVVVPVFIAAVAFAPEITLLSTVLIGLLIKDKMQESTANSGSRGPKIHSTPLHESGPSTESFPIPDPSDRGDLPPYVAHPDDFTETREKGGYEAHPEETGPQIFSTPPLDTDPREHIFMNENGGVTEPTLPPKTIVSENGIEVKHYTRSGDHGPAHLHITGGGREIKIGQNGKPIKGDAELSSSQKKVVQNNIEKIRKAVSKIQSWHQYNK